MGGFEKSEIERKFDVAESDELPDFTAIPGVDGVRREGDRRLDALYFDTPNLTLAGRRITLRRRTGGKDAGWHLKLPVSADERREITEPLTADPNTIPVRLRSLVLVHTRDRELIPVAQLKTRRTVIPLLAADGTVLAEFSDDRVEATILQEPVKNTAWREWEIELVDGPPELLDAAAYDFGRRGHTPSELPSKLARALGNRYPADSPAPPRPARKGPASAVLQAYLHEQIEALKVHDPGIREGTPDAVHQLRVAARRMRSVLASFRKLTEGNTAKLLREELQWLAGTVGEARDLEVMKAHLTEAIDAEASEVNTGDAKKHLEDHFAAAYESALANGRAALDSDRYFRLLDSLEEFLASPPLAAQAHKKAQTRMERSVNAERRRLKAAVKAFHRASDPAAATALHGVRKSAKRLRYAAEATAPIFGKQAARIARSAEDIQTILGEHQDSVICRDKLRSLATALPGPESGKIAFTYGRLHALEQQRAAEARSDFDQVWRAYPLRRLHGK